jgi:hypothetical protein
MVVAEESDADRHATLSSTQAAVRYAGLAMQQPTMQNERLIAAILNVRMN